MVAYAPIACSSTHLSETNREYLTASARILVNTIQYQINQTGIPSNSHNNVHTLKEYITGITGGDVNAESLLQNVHRLTQYADRMIPSLRPTACMMELHKAVIVINGNQKVGCFLSFAFSQFSLCY